MAHSPRLTPDPPQALQELAARLHWMGIMPTVADPRTGSAPRARHVPDPGAATTNHITEIAEHERSTRRWILPPAIVVIAAIVAFLVLLARPDL